MEGPDPELVRRACAGERAAFEGLVRHYQGAVYGLAYRVTYDAELARDIAQDVFLRLYQRLDRYDPSRPFHPWFMTLASNYTLNARAKAKLRKTVSLDAPIGDGEDSGPDPQAEQPTVSELAEEDETRGAVRAAIRALPETYAGVVALHYLEGLSVKEVAARLEIPEGTVKIRLFRARAKLKETLEP